jgi:ABC-type phosphate transport system substrate-binding protein
MTTATSSTTTKTRTGIAMSRRTFRAGVAGVAATLLTLVGATAYADPNGVDDPSTPIAGKAPSELYAAVGADAFAELTNNLVSGYNAQAGSGADLLESYDAVNPKTGLTDQITTKPGCTFARPNGANGGLSAMLSNLKSDASAGGDGTSYCIDWVRSSRSKKTDGTENGLTFYAQSRDAVSYAVVGHAYAPTAPLTTQQLKDIFECTVTDWSQVGGQPGPIHVYLPPASAATLTFFLSAIGSSLTTVQTNCPNAIPEQQNDGRTLNGDPLGIAPYAVTKWAAQENQAPGIPDNRGGAEIGEVNTAVSPVTTTTLNSTTYKVLNPAFVTANPSYSRLFYNVVRTGAPADLQAVFQPGGYLCTHEDALLVPYGNTPLGTDNTQSRYCGQAS